MHGGDIYHNCITMDFSVNSNPLGVPPEVRIAMEQALDEVGHYPELKCGRLRGAIAHMFSVEDSQVVCGNGASELLLAICRAILPKKALLTAPSFSGYAYALKTVGCEIAYHVLSSDNSFAIGTRILERMMEERPEIVFLTNPNNPTGQLIAPEILQQIADYCRKIGCVLVVDECFIELTGRAKQDSFAWRLDALEQVIIVRAFTKSIAIPGVRLGYLLCSNETLAAQIAAQLPEWNVSVVAQRAGMAALCQQNYLRQSVQLIQQERQVLSEGLRSMGFQVYSSDANFLLFYSSEVPMLYDDLLQHQILIRDCSDYEGLKAGFYRIAVKRHEDNLYLLETLQSIVRKTI